MGTNYDSNEFQHLRLRNSANDKETASTMLVQAMERMMLIDNEPSVGNAIYESNATTRRSSRFDETLQASISQALEMGRELMWHDSYNEYSDGCRIHHPEDSNLREPISNEVYPDDDRLYVTTERSRRSSLSRPCLRRKVTSESTIAVPRDTWSDFLNGRNRPNKSYTTSRRHSGMLSLDTDNDEMPPRQVDISNSVVDNDDISCLIDDESSFLSVSTTILNDFLYGDSVTRADDGDSITIDEKPSIPSMIIMDEWDHSTAEK